MIDANLFLDHIYDENIGLSSGVPGSLLSPITNRIVSHESLRYVSAVSEGEAVGIAAGSSLAGKIGVILIQNSGLGNVVNPITSLTNIYKIPVLLIVSHRGDPDSQPDAAQHIIMGKITDSLIDLMGIYRQEFPSNDIDVTSAVSRAFDHMRSTQIPAAFVLKRNMLQSYVHAKDLHQEAFNKNVGEMEENDEPKIVKLKLTDAINKFHFGQDIVISTTGILSRALFQYNDRPQNFYMQGSMGTAAALGLGISLIKSKQRIVVLDGDGAILMRLGSLATVGHYKPSNYIHVVFDNEMYASTGGQPSVSSTVSLSEMALAAGYRRAVTVYSNDSLSYFWEKFHSVEGPIFLHIKLKHIQEQMPSRPSLTPIEITSRFVESINNHI